MHDDGGALVLAQQRIVAGGRLRDWIGVEENVDIGQADGSARPLPMSASLCCAPAACTHSSMADLGAIPLPNPTPRAAPCLTMTGSVEDGGDGQLCSPPRPCIFPDATFFSLWFPWQYARGSGMPPCPAAGHLTMAASLAASAA